MTASILQQLLTLYIAVIYSWQCSSSEKPLIGKKLIHISQGFYRFTFLYTDIILFSLKNACLPCRLRQAYAVL